MSEKSMRSDVVRWMTDLHARSVENPCDPGTPDVCYVDGWIELKQLASWPDSGPVRVPKMRREQRLWLRDRSLAAKRFYRRNFCFLLLKVGRDWLLFDGEYAALRLDEADEKELRERALVVWDRAPKYRLAEWLTNYAKESHHAMG